jgi:lauroyl/myristoyl acyltransferase
VTSLWRRFFTWKYHFYELLLPALRGLGPARSDAIVCALGKASTFVRPGRRARLRAAVAAADAALDLDADPNGRRRFDWTGLAANAARFTARDYALDLPDDREVLRRFDVEGYDAFREELARGKGLLLVGSHLGAHIAGMHWLFRNNLPIRALVQRPKHVSTILERKFDATDEPYPQRDFFLRKDLTAAVAIERTLQARSALRDGMIVYLNGDIVWEGSNTRACRLLGRDHQFLAIWTELAALTRSPVYFVFCTHRPGGRFALEFKCFGRTRSGEQTQAIGAYMSQLEAQVAAAPAEAVAYLTWPCYTTGNSIPTSTPPSTRKAVPAPHRRLASAVARRMRKGRHIAGSIMA